MTDIPDLIKTHEDSCMCGEPFYGRPCLFCDSAQALRELQAVAEAARKLQGEVEGWAEDAGGYAPAWFDVEEALAKLDKP